MKIFYTVLFALVLNNVQSQYFQQEVNYKIQVKLDDDNHVLRAFEELEYTNNAPHALDYIYFHLWPNAYKNNQTAMAKQLLENGKTDFYYAQESDRGFIDSLNFKVNGEQVKIAFDAKHIDVCKLILNKPIQSGEKIKITTPFKVKIPKGIYSRLGHMDQAYQITQWYPKPAVYDHKGWHPMPYLTQGEFYSEYGSFEVSITLPRNYVVGATGDLQNLEEKEWLSQKAEKGKNTTFDKSMKDVFPPSDKELKTLVYKQDKVHDFAWFADKRWHVLKGEVALPHSKKTVETWSMFTNAEASLWQNSIEYINDAIYNYSLWNGDYPYSHMTAVDGALSAGAGMEYPNITVIGRSGNAMSLETVIMHETGHQWFYGILGSNERDHAWMDEGINTSNEIRYTLKKYPQATLSGAKDNSPALDVIDLNRPVIDRYYYGYDVCARHRWDQPIQTPSADYVDYNYGAIVYMKTGLSFYYLRAYLGDEKYDAIMQKYFDMYKFKHPYPEDLKGLFEQETKQDLDWFFKDLIQTDKKIDYAVSKVQKKECKDSTGPCYCVNIKNKGDVYSPFSVSSFAGDSLVSTSWYAWADSSKNKMQICANQENIDRIEINAMRTVPEINLRNNIIRTHGLFRKVEPLKLQMLASLERSDKTQIFWTPVTTWNNYDRWTLGLLVNSSFIPSQAFEYQLMPLYSFSAKRWSGLGHVSHTFYPKGNILHHVQLGLKGSSFSIDRSADYTSYFEKISPYVQLEFAKPYARSNKTHSLRLQTSLVNEYFGYALHEAYHRATYKLEGKPTLSPYVLTVMTEYKPSQFLKDFVKSEITAQRTWRYNAKGSSIKVRGFVGWFWVNNTSDARYNLRMDGVYGMSSSGYLMDYSYDHLYLGRSEASGFLSQQMSHGMGDFKIKTPLGQSNEWIGSLNLEADLPFSKIIGVFADAGFTSYQDFLYTAGFCIDIAGIQVYAPLLFSQNIQDVPAFSSTSFAERIRFVLPLEAMSPFSFIKKLKK